MSSLWSATARFLIVFLIVFAIAWLSITVVASQRVSPGEVVINRVSTAHLDWIELYNRTSREIDVSGFIISDGEKTFVLRPDEPIPARSSFLIVHTENEGEVRSLGMTPDLVWEGFRLDKEGREFVLLLNPEGNLMIDFVHMLPLERGQIIAREPPGSSKWWLVEGDERRPIDIGEYAKNSESWAEAVRDDPGEIAQAGLGIMRFLKEFVEALAAICAAVVAILSSVGRLPTQRTSRIAPTADRKNSVA